MKNILGLVLFLMSSAAFAASGSGQVSNVISLGGYTTTPSVTVPLGSITGATGNPGQGVFTITCGSSGNLVAADFYPCYKDGTAYSVASGNTFHELQAVYASSTGNEYFQMVSATAAITAASSSLTGGVYEGGAAAIYMRQTGPTANVPVGDTYEISFSGAASKIYIGIQTLGAVSYLIKVTGFETTP